MKTAIITEGTKDTGYGHLTRCLSLYQAFKEKGAPPLFAADCDEGGEKILSGIDHITLNWRAETKALLSHISGFDIAIVDSYLTNLEPLQEISAAVKTAAYLDDYMRLSYPPGIIINGTVYAEELPYDMKDGHGYLLGEKYILLRREFWDCHPKEPKKEIQNVMLMFGGWDVRNLLGRTLEVLLKRFPHFRYHAVGGSPINKNLLEFAARSNVHIYERLSASEVLNLMLSCDAAVSAAGQTLNELSRAWLPTVAVGVADNQEHNVNGWIRKGFLLSRIWYNSVNYEEEITENFRQLEDFETREKIVRAVKPVADGSGSRRIADYLLNEIKK